MVTRLDDRWAVTDFITNTALEVRFEARIDFWKELDHLRSPANIPSQGSFRHVDILEVVLSNNLLHFSLHFAYLALKLVIRDQHLLIASLSLC